MIEAEWWEHDDAAALADAIAGDIGFIIESALDARAACLLALSGGKTPVAAYEKLAAMKFDWRRVTIVPVDDRLVSVTDELSNAGMLARIFIPKGARVLPLCGENDDYKTAGNAADARLQDLKWPPDLVLLGVGEDGHTASILPGPDMDAAITAPKTRRAIGVMPDPLPKEAPVARVTMTRPAILSARALMLALTGDKKRALVEQAIEDGAGSTLPIGRVLAEIEQPIDIHWSPADAGSVVIASDLVARQSSAAAGLLRYARNDVRLGRPCERAKQSTRSPGSPQASPSGPE